jgi:pimeloyl-ACP methyl ester carboxylesterase
MDMDLIRAALGDQKLDYLGFSYGTYLGAVYAGLYPDRIRAMVLDGAIDPSIQPIAELDLQSAGFQTNLEAALAACTASSTCPWHPTGDPMAAFQALLAQVRAHPLKVAGAADALGPAAFLYGVLFTLYSPQYWTYLYQALAQLQAGNGKGLLQLFYAYIERNPDGSYPNLLEAEIAVNCLDVAAPPESAVLADAAHAASLSPFFGVANLYSELQCDVWPVKSPRTPAAVRAAGSPPILVVGSTNDPATPYREAQALASQLASGVLLTRNGYGHTAYPYSSCIRTYVDNYLIDLATPPVGTTCQTG